MAATVSVADCSPELSSFHFCVTCVPNLALKDSELPTDHNLQHLVKPGSQNHDEILPELDVGTMEMRL